MPRTVSIHRVVSAAFPRHFRLAEASCLVRPCFCEPYCGTEVGLGCGQDPSNRKPLPWEDPPHSEVRPLVQRAASLRAATPALRTGAYTELRAGQSLYVYARSLGANTIVVALNGDPAHDATVRVGLAALGGAMDGADAVAEELIGGSATVTARDGQLTSTVPARGATVWRVRRPDGT